MLQWNLKTTNKWETQTDQATAWWVVKCELCVYPCQHGGISQPTSTAGFYLSWRFCGNVSNWQQNKWFTCWWRNLECLRSIHNQKCNYTNALTESWRCYGMCEDMSVKALNHPDHLHRWTQNFKVSILRTQPKGSNRQPSVIPDLSISLPAQVVFICVLVMVGSAL